MSSQLPTKAVILARGLGTRMRAPGAGNEQLAREQADVADRGVKSMIPMSDGRPFLDYLLAALADAGIGDVCLVIGPEHQELRDQYSAPLAELRVRIHFAIQPEARGTADALLYTAPFIADDSFLSLNSDNYYPATLVDELRRQRAPALPVFDRETLIRDADIPRERIERYALLEIDSDGSLRRINEKPSADVARQLADAPVSMNLWHFTPEILEACRRVRPSPRGELELPLAVQLAIDELGMRFSTFRTSAPVFDLSHREDIPRVSARLASFAARA
jgi:glucose-1-phosphate thymidylyltransferase